MGIIFYQYIKTGSHTSVIAYLLARHGGRVVEGQSGQYSLLPIFNFWFN